MKTTSLCRVSALAALALLSAWPSSAEDRAVRIPVGGACASVYVECGPGARFSYQSCACVSESAVGNHCPAVECGSGERMNRTTCRCMPDDSRDFHGYEKFGADLRDSVNSGNQGSAAAMLSARFDGLTSAAGASAPAVAAYAATPRVAGSANPKLLNSEGSRAARIEAAAVKAIEDNLLKRGVAGEGRACGEWRTRPPVGRYGGCRRKGTCGK